MNGRRFNSSQYRLDKAAVTAEGFISGVVPFSRIGVYPYRNKDGSLRYELRHPKDVFDKESLDSFRGLPINIEHESLMDSPEAIAQYKVGQIGDNVFADGELVRGNIKIDHPRGIKAAQDGALELSAAYGLDLIEETGTYDGKPYTHRQTNIRGDHLTLTKLARLGHEMRIDSADAIEVDSLPSNQEPPMLKKINVDSVDYEVPPQVAVAFDKLIARADTSDEEKAKLAKELEDEKKEGKKNGDALQGRIDALTADLAKARADMAALEKDIPARAAAIAKDSATLMGVAQAVMSAPALAKLKGMDSAAVKVAVIKAKYPEANLDGKSADYIEARFDSIREAVKVTGTDAQAQNRADSSDFDFNADAGDMPGVVNLDAKRAEMQKRNSEAYLNPSIGGLARK
jgi:hypothetical protein